jgi:hypothetical protein
MGLKPLIIYVLMACVGAIVLGQIASTESTADAWMYGILACITVSSVLYELDYMGCHIDRCTQGQNAAVAAKPGMTARDFACKEADRITWRRALMLSFVMFVMLNHVRQKTCRMHFVFLLLKFVILKLYFDFDAHHRFEAVCRFG